MNRYPESDISSHAGDWLVGTARRNPEALLLLAAGCALLMRSGRGSSRSKASALRREDDRSYGPASASSRISHELSHTAGKATDYATEIKDKVSETASSYADAVSEFATDARRQVSEGSQRLGRQAQSTIESSFDRVLRDQPLVIAVAGLAAGAAIAAVFPSTDVEDRALGSAHEALSSAVDQAGKNVMGAANKVGEQLKAAAEEKGLTSQGLKDLAGDVTDTFTNAVAGKGTDQKDATSVPGGSPRNSDVASSAAPQANSVRDSSPARTVGPSGGNIR
jgi:hypothetical protein